MTAISLEAIGLTSEVILERISADVVKRLFDNIGYDDEADDFVESEMATRFTDIVKKAVNAKVVAFGEKHVDPLIESRLETLVLQRTNEWGEKQGKTVTFVEYMVQRAEAYMTEPVNYDGKTKPESNGYSWEKRNTRIGYMIDKHLHYTIERAMSQALKDANASITKGLHEAVKIALAEVQKNLKVEVKT